MLLFQIATMAGDPARPNEDFVSVLGGCAIMLDGSGAPGDLPTGCTHGVPWYVRQLGAWCLAGLAAGEPDEPNGLPPFEWGRAHTGGQHLHPRVLARMLRAFAHAIT